MLSLLYDHREERSGIPAMLRAADPHRAGLLEGGARTRAARRCGRRVDAGRSDTADWLERLARLEGGGPSEARGRPRPRRPTDDRAAVAEDVLTCLPGISTVGARRLLAHFGSLPAIFAASGEELRAVSPGSARFAPECSPGCSTTSRANGAGYG